MLVQTKWILIGGAVLIVLGGFSTAAQAQAEPVIPQPWSVPMLVRAVPPPVVQPVRQAPGAFAVPVVQPALSSPAYQPAGMPGSDWRRTYPGSPYYFNNPYNIYSPYYNPWYCPDYHHLPLPWPGPLPGPISPNYHPLPLPYLGGIDGVS